jgi:Na+/H+-dicarboxylate symporter
MFRKMPFILLVIIAGLVLCDSIIPLPLKELLYTISLSIKSVIVLLLPLIIFSLLFKTAVTLSSGATKFIGLTLILVCCSNFVSTFLSHYVGMLVYSLDAALIVPKEANGLEAMWSLDLPKIIANDQAMFAGIILGLLASKFWSEPALDIAKKAEVVVEKVLKGFLFFIPLFVAGFIVKLQHDGVMSVIIKDYSLVFLVIIIAQFVYIKLAYLVLNKLNIGATIQNLKNMLPATISAFSTMSSAASMPLTLIGVEGNTQNKDVAKSVVPMTVNIHLVGDCFAIPIFAYAVLKSFGMAQPDLMSYLTFSLYFVLAKFSVAAIPGGGIIVMLPILESYLGFNAEMMSFITALYILFDPVITSANVLGNGAFAKLIDRLFAPISAVRK